MAKRFLSVLLACVMVLAGLTGCGDTGTTDSGEKSEIDEIIA